MPLPIFPVHSLHPTEVNARPVAQVISGGTALNGVEDVITTDGGGRWRIDYTGINLRTPEQQRIWSAWTGYLTGGAVECLVPLLSLPMAPRPMAWDGPRRVTKLVANDPIFPTSVRYSIPVIAATVTASAVLRATSLQIDLTSPGEIVGGEMFSIGEFAYKIVRKTAPGTFQITPPLREAVSIGADVEFNWPVIRCRSLPGQDFDAPISLGHFSSPSITFVESPPVGGPA